MTTTTDTHAPSRGCYQRGCRLPECENENYRYAKQLEIDHLHGVRRLRDVTEVRTHIDRLRANKWQLNEIARAAGADPSTISHIRHDTKHVSRRIALAILSIPITPMTRPPQDERVDALGSTRRLRALAYLGHSWLEVAAVTGMTQDRLSIIARGSVPVVRPTEARKIAAAYRTLSARPGQVLQVATAARKKGWHGPFSWDDIDNPAAKPETCPQQRELGRDQLAALRRAEIEHLDQFGLPEQEIADRLGMAYTTVRNIVLELRNGQRRMRAREGANTPGTGLEAAA